MFVVTVLVESGVMVTIVRLNLMQRRLTRRWFYQSLIIVLKLCITNRMPEYLVIQNSEMPFHKRFDGKSGESKQPG